jgi:hypothetical protein
MSAELAASVADVGSGNFSLINLCGGGNFDFQYFFTAPINGDREVNWEPQETTIGVKPLFYMNTEPIITDVPEVWMDTTDTGESLTPKILALRALQDETCEGAPPPLMASWGDRTETCVLKGLKHEEHMHDQEGGWPIRVKFILTLWQVQVS